jgi:hypothetical protein
MTDGSKQNNKQSKNRLKDQSLKKVQQRFKRWRIKRQKRGLIPERLWAEAVRAVHENSPSRVSRALGLNYQELKRRVEDKAIDRELNTDLMNKFVEFDISTVMGAECIVEVQEGHGGKMKMHLKNVSGVTPVELVKAFLQVSR